MKKVSIIIFLILFINLALIIVNNNYNNDKRVLENGKSSGIINSNALTMMFETEAGSGEYQVVSENSWPQDGYVFNETLSKCENGGTLSWNDETKRVIISTNTSDKCYVFFEIFDDKYFNEKILADNPKVLTRTDFSVSFVEDNVNTIYVISGNMTEDINGDGNGETVYYFAGNALNNWVKFGKNEDDQDLYWRIIRINEDNSIRLLYAGTSPDTTEGYIGLSNFNDNTDDSKYVGYMYGGSGTVNNNRENSYNSTIKDVIDNWYEKGLLIKTDLENIEYHNYLSNKAIYCNDRSYAESSEDAVYKSFAAFERMWIDMPSYKCNSNGNGELYSNNSIEDKFNVNGDEGNEKLKYPIGLITADEIVFAGGSFHTNAKSWYYYNASLNSITGSVDWWTMSPYAYNFLGPLVAMEFIVDGSEGQLYDVVPVSRSNAVRPVISLKSCVYWSKGDGSSTNPYEVFIDDACSNVEN